MRALASPTLGQPPRVQRPGAARGPAPRRWFDAGLLGLILLQATLFSRLLTAVGAPYSLNFAHFAAAALFVPLALPGIRSRLGKRLVLGLGGLLFVIAASALLNGAGAINVLLDFLLLAEPFLLLLLLTSESMSRAQRGRLRWALLIFLVINLAFSHYQALVQGLFDDGVKGVFLGLGAGHHVGGAICLMSACYFLFDPELPSRLVRAALALACVAVTVLSDSKQVIAVFVLALGLLAVLRTRDVRRALLYAIVPPLLIAVLWLARESVPLLPMLDDGRLEGGLQAKFAVVPLLVSHFDSALQWLFGLGPGHTAGRLASLLPVYADYLGPLGATSTPLTEQIVALRESNYLSRVATGSSVWSPLFFWSGLWGDLGILGLASYLGLWWVVWRAGFPGDFSRFLIVTALLFGVVFTWLEEPAYTLFVMALLGIEWQRAREPLAP